MTSALRTVMSKACQLQADFQYERQPPPLERLAAARPDAFRTTMAGSGQHEFFDLVRIDTLAAAIHHVLDAGAGLTVSHLATNVGMKIPALSKNVDRMVSRHRMSAIVWRSPPSARRR
jgi:hypothetical protein